MLSIEEKVSFLKNVTSFKSLNATQLETLAGMCGENTYNIGEKIFSQGDTDGALYIVVEGQVALEREIRSQTDTVSLTLVKPGNYVGEISLFHDAPRSVTATAIKNTIALKLNNDDFSNFAIKNPDLLVELNHILCQRLVEAYDKISEVTEQDKPRELRKLYDKLDF